MKVGLLRLSALGDVILWSALVEQCQRKYPQVEFTWITSQVWMPLFSTLPVRWVPINKPRKIKDYWHLRSQFQQEEKFDVLLCGQASLRANLIYPFIKANTKIGFDNKRAREGHKLFVNKQIPYKDNHLLEGFSQFFEVAQLPLNLKNLQWPIHPDTKSVAFANTLPFSNGEAIGLVVAASKAERTWPIEHQTAFLELLSEQFQGKIILLGSNSTYEIALANKIEQKLNHIKADYINLVGKTSLPQLAAVIKRLSCVVSPDTGPAHLAQAVGTPVIGLYAVARAELSGPYQSPHTINAYENAALLNSLRPEQLDWHHRLHHANAMQVIQPSEVLRKTLHILEPA